ILLYSRPAANAADEIVADDVFLEEVEADRGVEGKRDRARIDGHEQFDSLPGQMRGIADGLQPLAPHRIDSLCFRSSSHEKAAQMTPIECAARRHRYTGIAFTMPARAASVRVSASSSASCSCCRRAAKGCSTTPTSISASSF